MFDWITPQMEPILWIVLGIIFAVTEGLTVQLTAVWFALGAAAGALVALAGGSPIRQFVVFVAVSGILLLFTRPLAKRALTVKKESTNADRVIGEIGVVLSHIDNDLGTGRVNAMGLDWSARTSSGVELEEGQKVKVLAIEGVKLIVEPYVKPS